MHPALRGNVRIEEAVNRAVGRFAMMMVFAMKPVLLYSAVSKELKKPALWTLETAQFLMVAYFLLGGRNSIQPGAHVAECPSIYVRKLIRTQQCADGRRNRHAADRLSGATGLRRDFRPRNTAVEYGERSYSSWAPPMAPINSYHDQRRAPNPTAGRRHLPKGQCGGERKGDLTWGTILSPC